VQLVTGEFNAAVARGDFEGFQQSQIGNLAL
jgi:hypothetical protein